MANERDPKSDLAVWLGEQLREARLAAGMTSQDALARDLGYDRTTINKVETGASPASDDLAVRIAKRFPGAAGGKFVDLSDVARRMAAKASKHPGWFGKTWYQPRQSPPPCVGGNRFLYQACCKLGSTCTPCCMPGIRPIQMSKLSNVSMNG